MNDYQQIVNSLGKYIHGLDENDTDLFASAFTDDAKFKFPIRKIDIQGKENLKSFCTRFNNNFKNISHMEDTFIIDINGNNATNKSYWKSYSGEKIKSYGTHVDTLIKDGNVWRIYERIIYLKWDEQNGFKDIKDQI
eukprot:TRINITY_DN17376_c0_g1_i1.p1 TRINITY_DN17376_c0_g1~~TRINITY_DN17376_c0_g1_i1.p1  ORF type:complete len:137 (-),score=24.27 TRINITY_DN17376_c0_g1_i1:131-541(-)